MLLTLLSTYLFSGSGAPSQDPSFDCLQVTYARFWIIGINSANILFPRHSFLLFVQQWIVVREGVTKRMIVVVYRRNLWVTKEQRRSASTNERNVRRKRRRVSIQSITKGTRESMIRQMIVESVQRRGEKEKSLQSIGEEVEMIGVILLHPQGDDLRDLYLSVISYKIPFWMQI